MAEEKETKKTTTKKTTDTKKKETKKASETKTTTAKKATTTKKAKTTKKVEEKETTTKTPAKKTSTKKATAKATEKKGTTTKTPTKKSTTKKAVSKEVKEIKTEQIPETDLEKTIIFDGKENENIKEVVEKLEEERILLDDKVINRSKEKNIIITILAVLIFAIIIGVTVYVVTNATEKVDTNQTLNSNIYIKVAKNYKTISDIKKENKKEDNVVTKDEVEEDEIAYTNIITISLSEFEEKILKKEDMTILISSTTCYHCVTFEPIINEAFKEKDKKIYRINVLAMSDKEIERFRTYYAFSKTPTIFNIKDGYAKAENVGTMTKEELLNWIDTNL